MEQEKDKKRSDTQPAEVASTERNGEARRRRGPYGPIRNSRGRARGTRQSNNPR